MLIKQVSLYNKETWTPTHTGELTDTAIASGARQTSADGPQGERIGSTLGARAERGRRQGHDRRARSRFRAVTEVLVLLLSRPLNNTYH